MKYLIVLISLLIVVVVAAILFVQAELDEMTFGILVRLTIDSFTLFINVKGILHQKIFYCLNLIFWIVMGCGIAHFGRRGLKTTET